MSSEFTFWNGAGVPSRWWSASTVTGPLAEPLPDPASPPAPSPPPELSAGRIQTIAAPRGLSGDANTRFLYVAEQGTVLSKSGGRVRISKNKQLLLQLPLVKLQGILLYGRIQVTNQCLRNLMDEGVWLSMFSRQGVYHGRIQPPAERGGHLRRLQWERTRDPDFCLRFAKAVVRGKLRSASAFAAVQAKNRLAETMGEGHRQLRESIERIGAAKDLDELRGIEGAGARAYFDLFRRWNQSGFPFEGRDKRGAVDPVNILLNFGYALVARELDGLVESAGLDPAAGFYHQPHHDRPSLACDLLEEFRHGLVDRLVIRLINTRVIEADDFEDHGERGVRFANAGIRKFVTAYEKVLVGGAEQPGMRRLFLGQLGRVLDSIRDGSDYRSHIEESA